MFDLSTLLNNNYGKDLYTTGNYGKDVGVGLLSSLNYAVNKPGKYYVKANYKGNGLADTGLGYMTNQNYTNPYDMMNALTSSMYSGKDDSKPLTFGEMKTKLSDALSKPIFSNLLDRSNYSYPLHTESYQLPQIGNIGGNSIGRYNDTLYDYNLPTQQYDYKLPWE